MPLLLWWHRQPACERSTGSLPVQLPRHSCLCFFPGSKGSLPVQYLTCSPALSYGNPASDYFISETLVALFRGYIVDSGVEMVGIVPRKKLCKIVLTVRSINKSAERDKKVYLVGETKGTLGPAQQ